jgi:hypothetical protein
LLSSSFPQDEKEIISIESSKKRNKSKGSLFIQAVLKRNRRFGIY